MLKFLRDETSPVDLLVVGGLVLLALVVPVLNMLVAESSALHMSTFGVTLLGK
jgi:urea transport system permease protein